MSKIAALTFAVLSALLSASPLSSQRKPEVLTFPINCAGGDCPLLTGAPQTGGVRGGSVKLEPGRSVGWHSTNDNEEVLVLLHGAATVNFEGRDLPVQEKSVVYIPSQTKHNVTNTGNQTLEYVWIVSPVRR